MYTKIKDTLLLVGDSNSARIDLRNIFQDSYHLLEAESLLQAIMLLKQNADCIALCLIDCRNPTQKDIASVTDALKTATPQEIPLVVFVDSQSDLEWEERAFMMGVADVILKPYSLTAIQKRIQILLDLYMHKWNLEKMVYLQKQSLQKTNQRLVDSLSAIIEHRNAESGNHGLRMRRFTEILLKEVARCCPEYKLTPESIELITSAAVLHDIGKISIPDAILNKPGKLTDEEFKIMKTHTTIGGNMIQQMVDMGDELYLQYAYNISLYHHERWDGKGYPIGLCGDDIPICAQVVGLADAFDALTTKRVYKPPYSSTKATNMILNGQCGTFSPKLLECFKHVIEQFKECAQLYSDGYSPKQDNISVHMPNAKWIKGDAPALELFNAKYQTLLHYLNDTIMEVDLENNSYHVVFNPDPDTNQIASLISFDQILETLGRTIIHPDDVQVIEDARHFVQNVFFQQGVLRRTFFFRVYASDSDRYQNYELILLRVRTSDANSRFFMAIWHRIREQDSTPTFKTNDIFYHSPALKGLVSSILRCQNNKTLTIDSDMSELTELTQYSAEEIKTLFDGQLLNLVYEPDRSSFAEKLDQSVSVGGIVEVEFRLLRKNSTPVWVLAKGRTYVESDGQEYFYFGVRNNSRSKESHLKLLSDLSRDRFLLDQSGSIVFDWDLGSDTMSCSPKWAEHFGYVPVSKNYGSQMGLATHFHPDDLIVVRSAIESLLKGTPSSVLEVRIANVEGKYLWTKITAAAQKNDEGKVVRIMGILQDINDLKQAAILLKTQAERDQLTKLLNKSSAQTLINEYLSSRAPDSMAGLLLLDLDNFKQINDRLGHMYGDNVLLQIGSFLRKFFRHHDIIGRIGGDEFIILLKDLPSKKLLLERCEALQHSLSNLLENFAPGLQVSCSIGVSIIPNHGTSYNQLFNRADSALYHAKHKGKNQYKIFSSHTRYSKQSLSSRNTLIDSDDPHIISNDSFERFVFHSLYESTNLNATINDLLAMVGKNFGVSRAYVFENNHDNTTCSNTFEWCNEGITPEIDKLQNISYITDIPGWPDLYNESNIIYCTDISQLAPPYQAILEPQGIKSLLHCAIIDQGVFRGYIGFDECNENKFWTKEQVSQLSFLAEALSVFLIRERNAKENLHN